MKAIIYLLIIFGVAIGLFFLYGYIIKLLIESKGLLVTSWWRSPEKNAAVGGATNSMHLWGLAWDVVPVTQGNEDFLRSLGLTVINEGDHLHAMVKL